MFLLRTGLFELISALSWVTLLTLTWPTSRGPCLESAA